MNWHDVPIYITNRNNLDRGFRRLILWLREAGMHRVTILDNESTWPPLLDFYNKSGLHVIHTGSNLGPHAFWTLGLHAAQDVPFIVADSDVVPTCPFDLVRQLLFVLYEYDNVAKVGPSLRIDNLPDHYDRKEAVLKWEGQFWQDPVRGRDASEPMLYRAGIDTTFALYPPRSEAGTSAWDAKAQHLRLGPPYVAEHVPWYDDTTHPSPELQHYRAHTSQQWSNW